MISTKLLFVKIVLLLTLTACRSDTLVLTAAPLPTVTPIIPTFTPGPILITIDGAVQQPGSYSLPSGSLADDAVRVAGGTTADADLARINLARVLKASHHVHVPRAGEILATPTPFGLSLDGRIDINLADVKLLETLPKIGPTTAQRIIEYREAQGPLETIEQILQVKGVGPVTFDQIKDLITVGPEP